jgi:hypothetical protein
MLILKGRTEMNTARLLTALLVAVALPLLTSCELDFSPLNAGGGDFDLGMGVTPLPSSTVRVYVRNESEAEFSVESHPIAVGVTREIEIHSGPLNYAPANTNKTFDIVRGTAALARVTYRVLKYPERPDGVQLVTITVMEGQIPDSFSAWSSHQAWIAAGVRTL